MSRRVVIGQARQIVGPRAYRTPLWYKARQQGVSASEIAVVCGLSRWDSPFNLWWHKRDGEGAGADTAQTSRGRRLEPMVLGDWADEHPEFHLRQPVGLLQSIHRPYQLATPDGLAYETGYGRAFCDGAEPVAVVEAKTQNSRDGWGEPGTDEIPDDYRCQVLWQMDTIGVGVGYVPVWFGLDQYAEYVVEWNAADIEFLRSKAVEFLASIDDNQPPPMDSHEATTERLKRLHPSVIPGEVEVSELVARQYVIAKTLRDAAADRLALAENRLRNQLGDYGTGIVADPATKKGWRKVVTRSVYDVKGGTYTREPHVENRLYVTGSRRKKASKR